MRFDTEQIIHFTEIRLTIVIAASVYANRRNLWIVTVTGREFTGYYRFLKGFYGLADIPTIFQERIDKTLEFKHPAWLDDIIIVTKGSAEKHEAEIKETMKELAEAGY